MTAFAEWLESIGLGAHRERFESEGVDLDIVIDLTDNDLREIGLRIGDRRRFLRHASTLERSDTPSTSPVGPFPSGKNQGLPSGKNDGRADPETDWLAHVDAERRHLTVLFADLVGSTALAQELGDPEDVSEVIKRYSRVATDAIEAAGGQVSKYIGDGIMAFFGWPVAHEDDAERAVDAGLALQASVGQLATDVRERYGIDISARVGIASGLVVVGNLLGDEDNELQDLFGETANLAARVEGAAEPGSVLLSSTTHALVDGRFRCRAGGERSFKGYDHPQAVFVAERRQRDRPTDTAAQRVGREREVAVLGDHWRSAVDGTGSIVHLRGEPGIGKSLLVDELHRIARDTTASGRWRSITFQCSPHLGSSPLHPVRERVEILAGIDPDDDVDERLSKIDRLAARVAGGAGLAVPIAADLLALDHDRLVDDTTPTERRHRLFEAAERVLGDVARDQPLLVVVEDVHWADPSTSELIDRLSGVVYRTSTLLVLTSRIGYDVPKLTGGEAHEIELGPIGRDDASELVRILDCDRRLTPEVETQIVDAADGVPLFVTEITRSVLDTLGRRGKASPVLVPETLHDSLLARLDRLPHARPVAQVAAAIGRSFHRDLLAEVVGADDLTLDLYVDELQEASILDADGDLLSFRHALIQTAAYDTMVRTRLREVHGRIADAFLQVFAKTARSHPETVAHHLARTADPSASLPWWTDAAQASAARSANLEALRATDEGLAVIADLPPGTADREELELLVVRCGALRSTAGFAAPVTGAALARARELCERTGDSEHLIPTMNGLYGYHLVHEDYDIALGIAHDLLREATTRGDETFEMVAHRAIGGASFHMGDLRIAATELQLAVNQYDKERHAPLAYVFGTDHAETSACFLGLSQWALGNPRRAEEVVAWSVSHSEDIDHIHSLAQALTYHGFLLTLAQDWPRARSVADRLVTMAAEHGLELMLASGRFWRGAAMFWTGTSEGGLDEMHEASDAWWATGAGSYRGLLQAMMADAHSTIGEHGKAAELVDEALATIERSGERWAEPEIMRIAGTVAERAGDRQTAVAAHRRAIELAIASGARMWQLRSTVSLAGIIGVREAEPDLSAVASVVDGWPCADYGAFAALQR